MGQVKVADLPLGAIQARALIVNNTLQTVMNLEDPDYDFWQYTKYIPVFAGAYPEGSKTLLLGMGGGTLVGRLLDRGLSADVVEIDGRMKDIAVRFFGLPPEQEVIVDDARHFVKVAKEKYSVIIYDTFISESAPEHVLTLEGLDDARRCLEDDGVLLINFYGYLEGPRGAVTRSVYKTLQEAGFHAELFTTPGAEQDRNILLVGSLQKKDWSGLQFGDESAADYFIPPAFVDTAHGERCSPTKRPNSRCTRAPPPIGAGCTISPTPGPFRSIRNIDLSPRSRFGGKDILFLAAQPQ
jgi:hypothetical protein